MDEDKAGYSIAAQKGALVLNELFLSIFNYRTGETELVIFRQ